MLCTGAEVAAACAMAGFTLRPGDTVVFNGWRRKVLRVEIFR